METRTLPVLDTHLSFVDGGSGPPLLFLHGNPTSSYLWRHVLPPLVDSGYRVLAVDLVGMGASGPSARGYRLVDHLAHLEGFLEALALPEVTLVGHDWGGVLAMALARRHPGTVNGVAVLETHLRPVESWSAMSAADRELFGRLRTAGPGEQAVLEENFFVETVLPSGILRALTEEEHDRYREPFPDPASRAPVLQWVREIPVAGDPADVAQLVTDNQEVLRDPAVPTLLLHGDPGALVSADEVAWCAAEGRAMTTTPVGPGTHFLPEDRPREIADALLVWLADTGRPGAALRG